MSSLQTDELLAIEQPRNNGIITLTYFLKVILPTGLATPDLASSATKVTQGEDIFGIMKV